MPFKLRFSLGQMMAFIALSALLIANVLFITHGSFFFHSLLAAVMSCAGIAVLLHHRRLSAWMWVWIAGQAWPMLMMAVAGLRDVLVSWPNYDGFLAIQLTLGLVCSLLTLVGFALTLRDVRRRLAIYESAA